MQKTLKLFFLMLLFATTTKAQDTPYGTKMDTIDAYRHFNDLNTAVLNGKVKKEEVQKVIKQLSHHITQWMMLRNQMDVSDNWIFPLKNYNYRAIGGNGDGYSDKGYRYLDGNKHGAHPAHDIFINDKNQDCIDDRTHKPVDVLAVDYGIVIACSNTWDAASNLRGGKYIWIYHYLTFHNVNKKNNFDKTNFTENVISYYAHNSKIFVEVGQQVKPGQKIAEVGRTGYNAYKKRSPTHLHFSAFKLVDDIPVPYNPYEQLKKAKTL
ncbi:M23 family metallopeptidase [Mucilaginibacter angelicae]|uniref:M23 family metallopeptidase n=1 Tax=Mucilaginibacter angelicae TaxID=869718 RepID=A0ABV6LAN7_9SPHI